MVLFVGRITRQKGVPVLLRAAAQLDPAAQLVLCAGQPDTEALAAEVTALVDDLREQRSGVIWLTGMLPKREVIQLLTHATVFVCPSLYEPLGHRQPGGDGLRHARWSRPGSAASPRWWPTARPGCWCRRTIRRRWPRRSTRWSATRTLAAAMGASGPGARNHRIRLDHASPPRPPQLYAELCPSRKRRCASPGL